MNAERDLRTISTRCSIVGGGPAGMMLGLLLARAGVEVVVLEKHRDFLRDFRGDTIHPSTLEVLFELGLYDAFLGRQHQEIRQVVLEAGGKRHTIADFTHLPTHARYLALVPQWEFLDFLAEEARGKLGFRLYMEAEAVDLIERDGLVVGVEAMTPRGPLQILSDLVIGADGRDSIVRAKARLPVREIGSPIDVLWMQLPRAPGDPSDIQGYLAGGHVVVLLDRKDYWQCAFVIPKGGFEALRQRGIPALQAQLAAAAPFLEGRLDAIASWGDVNLLKVRVDRLESWSRPGLLCIGDAAHAMSPIGGVGINLAIQDAVATANLLARVLRIGPASPAQLERVERRRRLPTRLTQSMQVFLQDRLISRALEDPMHVPTLVKLFDLLPELRRLPARLIGMGFRPEHVAPVEPYLPREGFGTELR